MKYSKSFVIAALLGEKTNGLKLKRDVKDVWELRSVNGHDEEQQVQKAYGDHSTQAANARPAMRSWVQLNDPGYMPICNGYNGIPNSDCYEKEESRTQKPRNVLGLEVS